MALLQSKNYTDFAFRAIAANRAHQIFKRSYVPFKQAREDILLGKCFQELR